MVQIKRDWFNTEIFIYERGWHYGRWKKKIPVNVFITANVIAALLFAAGHLPATFLTFQTVDAIVIILCFLYNGGLGLVFGCLYRKYGIQYAMIGHAGTHIISKVIWMLVI